ncbi:hypothetical protein HO133_005344 [Letharia lupina]|uniref:F-box domain-containing protein n=1 Tax=Letharia lupina TaxID=560253 RepID=A0A8H6C8Y6_9LECA|nr:uncharacterized protein HO133_005344 [Letharia lupina]KAF6218801.1 hypothetical protein HO133_005344 [Letharia lupina]
MKVSGITANDLSRYKMVNNKSRYSGPEPQTLPLPPELVVRTLSYLDQASDKKNARLVSKGFAAAGLSSLTSTVYFSTSLIKIGYLSKDLQFSSPVLEIAMHEVVSKYINKLVCGGTQLSASYLPLRDFQNWWATLGKSETSWPVQKIHSIYVSRYSQEKLVVSKGEDRNIFLTALERFEKLKCIVFTDAAANEQRQVLPQPTWPSAVPEGDLWGPSSPYHSFAMCIRSLSEMAIKLHELSIEGGQNAISCCIFSRASSKDYNHLLNVFASLRKISISVNTHQDAYPLCFAGLGRLLTHATLVQSLDLKCTGGRRQSRLILSRVFQSATWPCLKHFGLHGFIMHTDVELITFFERHRATIDSVALRSMFLHQKELNSREDSPCEAWKHFFGKLRQRSIKFQNLDLFRIQDCSNPFEVHPDLSVRANGGKTVLQYLRDGGLNPLTIDTINEADVCG